MANSPAIERVASLDAAGVQKAACAHCGLAVPAGLFDPQAERQFCCAGCRSVYEIIHECGLETFYRLRDGGDWNASPASTPDRTYAEFDDETFQSRYCRNDGELTRCELALEGVHCAACVWLIERLPHVAPGVLEARLEWTRGIVRLAWDPRRTALSRVARTLASLGYPPHPSRGRAARDAQRSAERKQLIRIAVAGACAGNAMLPAIALYGGLFSGMEPIYEALLRWASMIIGAVSLAWPGAVFYRGALAALRTRTAHLDVPIALGLSVGGVAGVINTIRGAGEIYFDSLTILVFLLLVGRFIQSRQQRRAADALEILFSLTPHAARRIDADGGVRETPIEALRPGDRVEVRAGDCVPVDGRILSGATTLDESLLSGESRPIVGSPGRNVFAGTLNLQAAVRIEVTHAGEQTRVGRLMQLVSQASQRKAPIVQLADRIAGWFVTAVIFLAAATFITWSSINVERAAEHTVALLIITCPCALAMATPLTVSAAIGRAARRGILIKGGDVLEKLSRPGHMLLDKTGTLTVGRFELVDWTGDAQIRSAVAALERHSAHPIGRALREALDKSSDYSDASCVLDVRQQPEGIRGRVDGKDVVVGAPRFVARILDDQSPAGIRGDVALARTEAYTRTGLTPIWIACDGALVALAGLGDRIRGDARTAIQELLHSGWRIGLLSGDHPTLATSVAGQLHLAHDALVRGGVTPEGKLEEIERQAHARFACGPIVMVGDGVNDAAALAAADVGIAVHGGAEASLAAADVYVNRPGVRPIVDLVELSAAAMRTIRTGMLASLGYNAIGVTLAAGGWLNPLIAALLMPLSSLTVLTLAIRTPRRERVRISEEQKPHADATPNRPGDHAPEVFPIRSVAKSGKQEPT